MQISFIILFMIDLYKDNHVRACMRACMCAFVNCSFKKTSLKLLTGLLPNFIVVFLRQRLKSSLHHYGRVRPVERYRCLKRSPKDHSCEIISKSDQRFLRRKFFKNFFMSVYCKKPPITRSLFIDGSNFANNF